MRGKEKMLKFSSSKFFNGLQKKKIIRNCISVISLFSLVLTLLSASLIAVHAKDKDDEDKYSYKTDSFITEIKANKNDTFDVKETINVDFTSPKHGIFRYIPVSLGEYDIKDIVVLGDTSDKNTDYNLKNKVIKIRVGNEDTLLKGKKQYIIQYKIVGIKAKKDAPDFLKLDLLPTSWNTPISYAKTSITMPKDVDWADADIYYGGYGSKHKLTDNKAFNVKSDYRTLTIETKNLPANEGITIRKQLGNGYWSGAQNYDNKKLFMAMIFVLLALLSFILWLLFGREPRYTTTVEFYPPEGMTPAEMGYLIDGSIDDKDIMSMIVYYANKGYMTIEDNGPKGFKFKKIKDMDMDEKRFSRIFFESIFSESDEVTEKTMPKNLSDKYFVVKDMLEGRFIGEKRIFSKKSTMSKWICMILMTPMPFLLSFLIAKIANNSTLIFFGALASIIMIIWLFFASKLSNGKNSLTKTEKRVYSFVSVILLLISTAIIFGMTFLFAEGKFFSIVVTVSYLLTSFFAINMNARTKESAKRLGKILGFKQFIETAELARLKALVGDNPSYFYNILPYAYVLGLSDDWIKKFEHINIEPADWYISPYGDMFNMMIYMNIMDSIDHSIGDIIDDQISESSSDYGSSGGFGGGGFSGGGFGGGGGGAW